MSFRHSSSLDALIVVCGDIVVLYGALFVTLLVRYGSVPSGELFLLHVVPFSILFAIWLVVFYIAGLYEKYTRLFRSRLPRIIFNAHLSNTLVALLFFYFIPYFGITPKTVLFIYLIVSFVFILLWRQYAFWVSRARTRAPSLLIGSGEEMHELMHEVHNDPRYGLSFILSVDLERIEGLDFKSEIVDRIYREGITTVIVDTHDRRIVPMLPKLYNLIFSKVRFIDMHKIYEDVFDRVPLSLVQESWFLENISATQKTSYEFLKRTMDIAIALPLFIVSLLVYPFVWVAIKLEDGGSFFYITERIGKNNTVIYIPKIRSMSGMDSGDEALESTLHVTRVGKFVRTTRIDELPQLWSVLKGDLSLIGPRPEIPSLVREYEREVPYYQVRHLVTPGISGWAQIYHDEHPHHGVAVERTRTKLSYDLYYIKNRSFILDLKVALKTVKTLLSRVGR